MTERTVKRGHDRVDILSACNKGGSQCGGIIVFLKAAIRSSDKDVVFLAVGGNLHNQGFVDGLLDTPVLDEWHLSPSSVLGMG